MLQSNLKIHISRDKTALYWGQRKSHLTTSRSVSLLADAAPEIPWAKVPDRVILRGGYSLAVGLPCAHRIHVLTWHKEAVPSCIEQRPTASAALPESTEES